MLVEDIDQWIPQRGAMQLLHRVLEADEDHAVAEALIDADGLFVRDGVVPVWIGIEYMAQTIAAWASARGRRRGGNGPRLGLLLGTRRYTAHGDGFACGALLRIEVRCELCGDNGLGLFECDISVDGRPMASATVSVFEPANTGDVLAMGATA